MAERRMFAKTIIDSDAFLDMPLSAQALYFHLSMRADDDGFVNNPKKIQRMMGASDDDYKILIAKSFILLFDSGVIVIKHWRINNYIQKDRYKETVYTEEKDCLSVKDNGAYTLCIQNGYNLDTQYRLGKDSLDKNIYSVHFESFWKNYPRKKEKQKAYKAYQARLNDGYSEDQLLEACINYCAECEHLKREERYIKLGATFLSVNEPFVDYLDKNYTAPKPKKSDKPGFSDFSERKYNYAELEKIARGETDDSQV